MQKLTYGFVEIYVIERAMTSQKLRDSYFFLGNANLNKLIPQVLHLNALYPLVPVPFKKDVSCLSLEVFVFSSGDLPNMAMNTESDGNLKGPQREETWPKTNPRTLRELKI